MVISHPYLNLSHEFIHSLVSPMTLIPFSQFLFCFFVCFRFVLFCFGLLLRWRAGGNLWNASPPFHNFKGFKAITMCIIHRNIVSLGDLPNIGGDASRNRNYIMLYEQCAILVHCTILDFSDFSKPKKSQN